MEPTQPGRSDRSVVAGQTVHGSVRPPSARSDRLRLWRLCIATKNQTSATDQWGRSDRPYHAGQTGLRPTVRPQVTFQLNRPLVKRRYLLTRVSEFGVFGLYGKLIQRAIQPMKNPSKKHNLIKDKGLTLQRISTGHTHKMSLTPIGHAHFSLGLGLEKTHHTWLDKPKKCTYMHMN
uniref:Uncharacterized protein n=2 Tax=Oryza sativa subsp. japonica TaxID=39947 RepID=Q10RH8_ORYSJ|nr:Hypothetical protein [Oryza sativa Japonica Group]ABF94080.1 transposon protein, putative, unclassified [Oryza sativa Japonica Group]